MTTNDLHLIEEPEPRVLRTFTYFKENRPVEPGPFVLAVEHHEIGRYDSLAEALGAALLTARDLDKHKSGALLADIWRSVDFDSDDSEWGEVATVEAITTMEGENR